MNDLKRFLIHVALNIYLVVLTIYGFLYYPIYRIKKLAKK